MRYGLFALGLNLLYVGLAFLSYLFVPTASGGLSTKTFSFIMKTTVLRTRLSSSYLYCFRAAISHLSRFFLMSASLAGRRVRSVRGNTFPEKPKGTADEKSRFGAPNGWVDSIMLN